MINVSKKWTLLDKCIYYIETKIKGIAANTAEPDVETMIQAKTEHLQHENELLKKKQYPGILKKDSNNQYFCPDCHEQIETAFIEQKKKFCPECGKRIIIPVKIYATSHNEKETTYET